MDYFAKAETTYQEVEGAISGMAVAKNTWEANMGIFNNSLSIFKGEGVEACMMRKHILQTTTTTTSVADNNNKDNNN
jgi:hypothetical protein